LVPFLKRLVDFPIQVPSDRLAVERLRLTLKTTVPCNPSSVKAGHVYYPTVDVHTMPLKQPVVTEALALDIKVMSEVQFERRHIISDSANNFCSLPDSPAQGT